MKQINEYTSTYRFDKNGHGHGPLLNEKDDFTSKIIKATTSNGIEVMKLKLIRLTN